MTLCSIHFCVHLPNCSERSHTISNTRDSFAPFELCKPCGRPPVASASPFRRMHLDALDHVSRITRISGYLCFKLTIFSEMSRKEQVISIPSSPASSVSLSPEPSPRSPITPRETRSLLASEASKQRTYLKERFRTCREKTLESELCRTINQYLRSGLSDDRCRRITAIVILVLAVIGLYHVLLAIF